ncbi:MAG TPA: type II secretion system secretin GspD [Rhodanobacter sp.]|nr:type II secretion system secretin GspD [Rhodanobacter sp.]
MARLSTTHVVRTVTLASFVWLVGCTSLPQPRDDGALQREAMAGTHAPVPAPLPLNRDLETATPTPPRATISEGSGRFVRPTALATPHKSASGKNAVTFNFENQPVQAVVKAILGDLLKQNYTIVPGVEGNISFSTSQPVDQAQALPILETLLSWTHNALIRRAGGYVVLPEKDAASGNLVPSLGAAAPAGGLQARLFPLQYISATEMQKLIKPFVGKDAILLVDPSRNLLVLAGTAQELADDERMVRTFDVDWLRGTSVGVFNLQYARVGELMPKLDSLFGEHGSTPLAGMLRFIPIERTNALVVISTQPDYLREVGEWIDQIDAGGGNQPQLFVYDVRNLKASDLARYLAQIYANGSGSGGDNGGRVGPGLSSGTLGSADNMNASSLGSTAGSFGNTGTGTGALGSVGLNGGTDSGLNGSSANAGINTGVGGTMSAGASPAFGSNQDSASAANNQQYASSDGSVRISSVDANNQLLIRARPSQWEEIKRAIDKLDSVPLQVQIETRILEVRLTGQFQFGVQWYLQGLSGSTTSTDSSGNPVITPGHPSNPRQIGLGQGGNAYGGEPFFYSFLNSKLQVAVRAMETSGNTKTLSAPSMVVMNNQVGSIQVGDNIPINQTTVNTGIGAATSYNSVQYLTTGVILKVRPRINPGGLVYMDVSQQVSQRDNSQPSNNGNPAISQRELSTQVAVQSGQTVLLGGLIQQDEGKTDTGIPGLNRVPVIGRLFGTTNRNRDRTELIVLITPRIIRNSEDARQVTDEYQEKFESLAPLRHAAATSAANTPTATAAPNWPEQLQQHAESALQHADYAMAQDLAMQSWQQGLRRGPLCERNWQVMLDARTHSSTLGSVEEARAQQAACLQPATR